MGDRQVPLALLCKHLSLSLSLLTPLTFRRPPISVFTDTHNYSLPLHRKAASQWLQMTHSLLHNSARLTLHALLKMSMGKISTTAQ